MNREYKHVLATKQDLEDELMSLPYVNKCWLERVDTSLYIIHAKLSVWDYLFRRSRRESEIFSLIRPRIPFTMTYELKFRLL